MGTRHVRFKNGLKKRGVIRYSPFLSIVPYSIEDYITPIWRIFHQSVSRSVLIFNLKVTFSKLNLGKNLLQGCYTLREVRGVIS